MVIANPIYDVVFKRLMENDRVAKFFLSTMLGQQVESLELKPQVFTYDDEKKFKALGILRLFRVDFMAVVRTDEGTTKKILIEVQKAKDPIDQMRFRNYLAEQYKKQDMVNGEEVTLPITTIYILGFTLPEIETACVHVARQYRDLINQSILEERNEFIENLTHDSYVVQVKRINGKYQTKLDKLLSIFEQNHFIDDTTTVKEYLYDTDDEDIKEMTDILHYVGTDPKTRKELEIEREAHRTINAMIRASEKRQKKKFEALEKEMQESKKALQENKKEMREQEKALQENKKEMQEKEKALQEKEKALEAQKKLIEELKKRLGE